MNAVELAKQRKEERLQAERELWEELMDFEVRRLDGLINPLTGKQVSLRQHAEDARIDKDTFRRLVSPMSLYLHPRLLI